MEIAPTTSFATDEQVQEHLEDLLEEGHDLDEESWIDGLLTRGFHAINDDELFGEEITGYSLY